MTPPPHGPNDISQSRRWPQINEGMRLGSPSIRILKAILKAVSKQSQNPSLLSAHPG